MKKEHEVREISFIGSLFFGGGWGVGGGEFNDVICLTQEHQRDIKEVSLFHLETFMLKTFVLVQASVECCATPATSKT